ncbi:hypothetical protein STENM36S_00836 [Streptomyces tendae]
MTTVTSLLRPCGTTDRMRTSASSASPYVTVRTEPASRRVSSRAPSWSAAITRVPPGTIFAAKVSKDS